MSDTMIETQPELPETAAPSDATPAAQQFVPDMTVGQAMALHANARWVFASYHLGGCSHCAISNEETIEQVAEGYGVPLDKLLEDLNSLFNEGTTEDVAAAPAAVQE
jgi:hybrid cluster-associated redox disulfide protein